MKSLVTVLAGTLCLASTVFAQFEIPPREVDANWMQNFDKAYSVYLDGSNRTAGIKGLTKNAVGYMWRYSGSQGSLNNVSVQNDILSIRHTRTNMDPNFADISLITTDWMGGFGVKFPHLGFDTK